MMRIQEKVSIPTTIAKILQTKDVETQNQYIRTVAMRSGFHPGRFGFYNPQIIKYSTGYYITWERDEV